MSSSPTTVRRLVGIYNASGSIVGELAYFVGSRVGRAHCALCDITHGAVREKAEWRACRGDLPVPFETVHLDERTPALVAVSDGQAPCVVADTDSGMHILLDSSALERCGGSPRQLVDLLLATMEDRGLTAAP